MVLRLLPREEAFFDLFDEAAQSILQVPQALKALVDDYPDAERRAGELKAAPAPREEPASGISPAVTSHTARYTRSADAVTWVLGVSRK